MDKATEKVLERIRNLYAMSKEVEASPHEAEIALRRCQALMSRYGVNESDLETSEFGSVSAYSIRKQMPTYITVLAASAALLHDCLAIRLNTEIEFRGYSVDSQVARLTFDYLNESLQRQLQQAKLTGSVDAGRSAAHDFRIGFALQVYERCKEIDRERRKREQDSATTRTSLVVRKLAMVNANCAKGIARSKKKRVTYRDTTANSAGRFAGRRVSLNSQVTDTRTVKALT